MELLLYMPLSVNPKPYTLSLSQLPIPYMLVLGSLDKETDVADVDVNSMKSMLLYRGCKTVKNIY